MWWCFVEIQYYSSEKKTLAGVHFHSYNWCRTTSSTCLSLSGALFSDFLLSARYKDGEPLTPEDEKLVVEKLLAHHPRSQDKIGSGLDSIMVCFICNTARKWALVYSVSKYVLQFVSTLLHTKLFSILSSQVILVLCTHGQCISQVDRHPQFRHSRCLFVVRTDGGWIDFSYQKCLRAYIRNKYPSHAERFINTHLKRGRSWILYRLYDKITMRIQVSGWSSQR